jgi:hypothetical protein
MISYHYKNLLSKCEDSGDRIMILWLKLKLFIYQSMCIDRVYKTMLLLNIKILNKGIFYLSNLGYLFLI